MHVELVHLHADEVVLATGAAELQPVCPGNRLRGLFTAHAAERAHEAGIDLPDAVAVGAAPDGVPCRPVAGRLVRLEGDERHGERGGRRGRWSRRREASSGRIPVPDVDPRPGVRAP